MMGLATFAREEESNGFYLAWGYDFRHDPRKRAKLGLDMIIDEAGLDTRDLPFFAKIIKSEITALVRNEGNDKHQWSTVGHNKRVTRHVSDTIGRSLKSSSGGGEGADALGSDSCELGETQVRVSSACGDFMGRVQHSLDVSFSSPGAQDSEEKTRKENVFSTSMENGGGDSS